MKAKLLLLSFLFISITVISQNKKLQQLDRSQIETSILIPTSTIFNIEDFQDNTNSVYSFKQAYKLLGQNDFKNRLNNPITIDAKAAINHQVIPIAILHADYQTIVPEAFTDGRLSLDDNQNLINVTGSNSVYRKNTISISAPLIANHKGLTNQFIIKERDIYNTTNQVISKIEIDFDDTLGFRAVNINTPITVTYTKAGNKVLKSRITLSNQEVFKSKSTLNINYSAEDLNANFNRAVLTFNSTIAPNLTPYGVANDIGTGEYDVFLSSDNILDKPIFVIDGFDPGDTRDVLSIYNLLNFEDNGTLLNLGDQMRTEGFDIVVLNFPVYTRASDNVVVDGGADFIERNAMLLVELINLINAQKIGTEQNVIIGPSMGGLISRYALNYMENQNIDHDTRLWISFDSPHQGANVPIGFQHLFNYMAFGLDLGGLGGDQSIVAVQPLINDFLKSAAARQMLTDQFEPHLASGSNVDFDSALTLPIAHPYHNLFFSGLNGLTTSGFPENVRKVSMINGSGINARYPDKLNNPVLPNRQILDVTIPDVAFQTDATFRSRFTPYAGNTNQISYLFIDAPFICFCDLTASANGEAFSYTDGIDAASGGLFDLGALSGGFGTDPLINTFFNALQIDYFNFIPSVSSMALEITNNEVDWFHTPTNVMTARAVNDLTPFDNWYMPDANQSHVTLTPQNVAFAISEIMPTTLSTNTIESNSISIIKNPVKNYIAISSDVTISDASLKITDITGKLIYNVTTTLDNNTQVPIQLASGLYVLSIEDTNNTLSQFKIVVE
ncbi:T9SS type A sorting domain-containing protein [Olleya aquimaris]|uniref:Putative secreted protein (Por secretion system target) n=1 Tax=Olleya aquimaris TaxID=639310 RepID=A0A327RGS4_9FLAO|nr:T9SS type A sorting domain-containing protein [Olleya aquimaris]RAJ14643.1 putative secreted protein (Por secretion system target) [Olleya aquimaris]